LARLRVWLAARRLRRAQEQYAEWKGRHNEFVRQLCDPCFRGNPYNVNQCIKAAGKKAFYEERVEQLMRGSP
jgi:hypothetical protein